MEIHTPKGDTNNKLLIKKSILESDINISYSPKEKFEFITKSKEINSFKEEILLYLRERDSFLFEKINALQLKSDINTKKIEELSETLDNNYNTFLLKQVEISSKLEKLKTYDAFINKANDKLISQEIRLNAVREDISNNFQKYDKIYLENLIVPGYIGKGAKYTNCKIFFTEIIKNIEKLNIFKEKNIFDLSSYKDRLENIIKTFQYIVDNYNNSHIQYITKLNEQSNKNILEIIDEKLNNLRMENSHFSLDLLKKANELNSIYDKTKQIKNDISEVIDKMLIEYNNKIQEINKSFKEYQDEQEKMNKKFMSLFNLIKVEKYSKNLRFQFSSQQQNKDIKNLKNNYESNDNNIKLRNFFELKSNLINNRLSKSQNNFNSNNNIINLQKKINITENSKKIDIKKQRNSIDSILNYSRTSSVKSYQKANNILNYNINIKKQKGLKTKMPFIDTSKSQRNNHTTIDLIKNVNANKKKEKDKMISYEELTDIKSIKTNNKEDDISLSGNFSIDINNSLDSFTTANDNNNTINNINIKTKLDKFGLIEKNNDKNKEKNSFEGQNDKIIKEIAAELEQSSAKGNILCSNKKEIEKNFKSICDKIQPINLKLNNHTNLEKIEESGDKNNNINNYSNKSEQTIFSNINLNNININKFHLNENISDVLKKNKLLEIIEAKDKIGEKNNNDNKKENINIEDRMYLYDKKIINLEGKIDSLQKYIIKIINSIKKEKEKKNKNINSIKILGYKTINNTNNSLINKKENNFGNNSKTNNENKNILNLTSKNFNEKSPTIEISSRLNSMPKNMSSNDNNNLSLSLFHNGKYYANIKHIFGQKEFQNKKLLKSNISNKENNFNISNNNII